MPFVYSYSISVQLTIDTEAYSTRSHHAGKYSDTKNVIVKERKHTPISLCCSLRDTARINFYSTKEWWIEERDSFQFLCVHGIFCSSRRLDVFQYSKASMASIILAISIQLVYLASCYSHTKSRICYVYAIVRVITIVSHGIIFIR